MGIYIAPRYTRDQVYALAPDKLTFPYSTDFDAVYDGLRHQYRLTKAYFTERGINLDKEPQFKNNPDLINKFLQEVSTKVYNWVYRHSKSNRRQINYMIAKRGLLTFPIFEYRQAFLEAMFLEGEYLLENGDISKVTGVDLDTMQNMSADVIRNQDRDMSKEAIGILNELGLCYYGRYRFFPVGNDW